MSGGYYDPAAPGAHPLNPDEFGKVCLGSLGALVTNWCAYLGCPQVRQVLFRVANNPRGWRYAEGQSLDVPVGEDAWSFEHLQKACEVSLTGYCLGWSAYLGVEGVVRELCYLLDESDWSDRRKVAKAFAAHLIQKDAAERKDN